MIKMDMEKKTRIIFGVILILVILLIGKFWIVEKRKSQILKLGSTTPMDQRESVSPAAIHDAALFFDQDSVAATVGQDFNLVARVNPGSNTEQGINAVQLDVTFDPTVMQLSKVTPVAPFMEMSAPIIDSKKGTVLVDFFIGASQVTAVSDVATLSFHAKGAAVGATVDFSPKSDAAVNDGKGTMVTEARTGATVNIAKP